MSLKNFINKSSFIIKIRKNRFLKQNKLVKKFLQDFFNSKATKTIIQIGANDGVMSDPLREFLIFPGNYRAILIEPIPYYVEKLRSLYKNREDIQIVHAAIGEEAKTEKLFYIPPEIADLMNGDGPKNNWAHGQGSFERSIVENWINKNNFRGVDFCKKIPFFISSIDSIDVSVKQLKQIILIPDNTLMVIDVQGYELEVLNGLDWNNPPKHIMIEDDLFKESQALSFLKSKGYKFICGVTDKVFSLGKYYD